MSPIAINPIYPLLRAWKRFRLRRGEKLKSVNRDRTKPTKAKDSHHRHAAFLEFP